MMSATRMIHRICTALLAGLSMLLAAPAAEAQNARIVQWVEYAAVTDNSKIALGYPVPVPVDTPYPFAGFRSYDGLHVRHQDLAVTTSWVHPEVIGTTRQGRPIWLYRLGDANLETAQGLGEPAMLTNGGIHAREWQSPEVATGIIELLALAGDDNHLVSYLRDNANILVIPVLNIDGFLQSQSYPATNWLGTDPTDPEGSPRDGRMRRKNMLGPDGVLATQDDHLLGVDLNRNNEPFWATNPARSSDDPERLIYHGDAARSEPESQALVAAAELAPPERLSMYTDVHSFSQVHLWGRSGNDRLARLTERLLRTFSNHHRGFAAGKYYAFSSRFEVPRNEGIGATDELFTQIYQVPSWTLEIEPSNGAYYHAPLPGAGADYGGLGRNGHDGFILPESEIERVRTELASTFAIAYYQQSGPPAVTALRLIDAATGVTVFEAEWDTTAPQTRELYRYQAQPLQLDRDYRAWVAWNKPMRWRRNGQVEALPGQSPNTLELERALTAGGEPLEAALGAPEWLALPGGAPSGFARYRDDAVAFSLRLPASSSNAARVQTNPTAALELASPDMVGQRGDADPSTVARWEDGAWAGYEDSSGNDQTDAGGVDRTMRFEVSAQPLGEPHVVEPGTSAMWYDTSREGEGFMLEVLSATRALLYWFTYDDEGGQDWYFGDGEIRGNRIVFRDLLRVSGGEFGPGFDPDRVSRAAVGSASFIWSTCDTGAMSWVIDRDGGPWRQGRMNVSRLTRVMGLPCSDTGEAVDPLAARQSGSWYDPSHSGEGFSLEVMSNGEVLLFWFSYDSEGHRRWFFGTGRPAGPTIVFDEMFTTTGGVFGPGFDPEAVQVLPWGSMELELACSTGVARFTPTEAGFPAGELQLVRLSLLAGFSCAD
jgi:hypothetical protein